MATSVGRENQAMIEGIAWYCSLAQGILSREIERMQNAEKGWVTNRSEGGSLRERGGGGLNCAGVSQCNTAR